MMMVLSPRTRPARLDSTGFPGLDGKFSKCVAANPGDEGSACAGAAATARFAPPQLRWMNTTQCGPATPKKRQLFDGTASILFSATRPRKKLLIVITTIGMMTAI
jgi:hypothetical protein